MTDDAPTDDAPAYHVVTDDRAVFDVVTDEVTTDDAGGPDPSATDEATELDAPRDWAWVEEWREGDEPVPWGPGLTLSGFTLILVASAVYVLSSGLSDRPIVVIAVNLLVAAGLGPGTVALPRVCRSCAGSRAVQWPESLPPGSACWFSWSDRQINIPRGHRRADAGCAVRPASPARPSAARRTGHRRR